jgi:hypothetical protein
MATEAKDATEPVVTVNVAELVPAVTVALDGTLATVVLALQRVTAVFVAGGPVNVTVPVADVPPCTLAGAIERLRSFGAIAVTANTAVFVSEPETPVIVAAVFPGTANVVTLKPTELAPAGTTTLAGTVATIVSEDERVTT